MPDLALAIGSLIGIIILVSFGLSIFIYLIIEGKLRISNGKIIQVLVGVLLLAYCGVARGISLLDVIL